MPAKRKSKGKGKDAKKKAKSAELVVPDKDKERRERVDRIARESNADNIRIFDHLADLFSGMSECVAVCLFNKQLLIAANEFNNNLNQQKAMAQYISDIARHVLSHEAESNAKETIKKICASHKDFNKLTIPDKVVKEDILELLFQQKNNSFEDLMRTYGNYAPIAAFIAAVYTKIIKSHKKVEKYIQNENTTRAEDGPAPAAASASRVKNDQSVLKKCQFEILRNEPIKNNEKIHVHAEVQILAHIIKIVDEVINKRITIPKTEMYIGISKLSCMHCELMIQTANQVFITNNIPINIKTRGVHNLGFENWACPAIFLEGYNAGSTESQQKPRTIAFQIGNISKKLIKETLETTNAPSHVSMYRSATDSSDADANEVETNCKKMEERLKSFISVSNEVLKEKPKINLEDLINEISIAAKIYALPIFKRFTSDFIPGIGDKKQMQRSKAFIHQGLGGNAVLNLDRFNSIITNRIFFVKEIADYFDENSPPANIAAPAAAGAGPGADASMAHMGFKQSNPALILSAAQGGDGLKKAITVAPAAAAAAASAPGDKRKTDENDKDERKPKKARIH